MKLCEAASECYRRLSGGIERVAAARSGSCRLGHKPARLNRSAALVGPPLPLSSLKSWRSLPPGQRILALSTIIEGRAHALCGVLLSP